MLLGLLLAGVITLPLAAQEGPPSLGGTVGIKITATDVRSESLEADFDVTMYTRLFTYSTFPAGVPTFGLPAIDYGDGDTLPTTTLVLASAGGGPGGSNVYQNLASFTHTYPSPGPYTVTAAGYCTLCGRSEYTIFPAGSPGNPTYTGTFDLLPTMVIGNLAATTFFSGTTSLIFSPSYSVRYAVTLYYAVTNTTRIFLDQNILEIPTASTWGLAALGGLLLLSGLLVLRRI
ncbi:MAG: hypothetical protein PVG07_13745 [Acidobacteriota bacterium]